MDNVGIGTTSPSRLLEIFGLNPAFALNDSGTSDPVILFQDAGSIRFSLRVDESNSNAFEIRSSANTSRLLIRDNGNVGIGTTNPGEKLEVIGNGKFTGTLEATGNLQIGGDLVFPDGSVQTSAVNFLPPDTCFDNVGRFVVCGNGAVKDNLTGLFWLEDANCPQFGGVNTWADANIAAAQLADGQCGLTDNSSPGDWRLPTVEEWQVIVDQAIANLCSAPYFPDTLGTGCCGVDPCAFAGVQSNFYWSSATGASNPFNAWYASLNFGSVNVNFLKTLFNFVWPVRAGP